ncbi:hypothetical protein BDR22DRAFT_831959, partial [Usnea florida]
MSSTLIMISLLLGTSIFDGQGRQLSILDSIFNASQREKTLRFFIWQRCYFFKALSPYKLSTRNLSITRRREKCGKRLWIG